MLRSSSTRARLAYMLLVLILLTLALVPAAGLAAPLAVPTIDIADG
jgi:hypothetical protein